MSIIDLQNSIISPTLDGFNYTRRFQTGEIGKQSKTVNFFEQLYSYPQKLTFKWDFLNGSKQKTGSWEPFNSTIFQWEPNYKLTEQAIPGNIAYKPSDYIDGFFNKIYSSKFYKNETKDLQLGLSNIPVFVILNGDNEIVLNKSRPIEKSTSFGSYVKEIIYDACGAFDLNSEKFTDLGLLFLNFKDAENYLNNLARTDIDGVKTVGLSIHCIGLDSAYRITREYHPGVDFRFVPKIKPNSNTENGVPVQILECEGLRVTGENPLSSAAQKFVFFDENASKEFYKDQVKKYRSVKLRTDSLENLFESWEESILANTPPSAQTYFIPDSDNIFTGTKITPTQKLGRFAQQKTRILKKFVGHFFSVA